MQYERQYAKYFIPLESDPEIFTDLMHELGVSPSFSIVDVWSLEQSVLQVIPRPVLALILVLPPCPAYNPEQKIGTQGGTLTDANVVWLKQTINNACGLYALLHAVCNRPEVIRPESLLDSLIKLESSKRVEYLERSEEIESLYTKAAKRGGTDAPPAGDLVDPHYICLVNRAGQLYELDGDREGPLHRGCLGEGDDVLSTLGLDVIQTYIDSQTDGGFCLLALVASESKEGHLPT